MAKIYNSMTELIGSTPLLKLNNFNKKSGVIIFMQSLKISILLESVKDRIALAMVEDAEKKGKLKPGATIIELKVVTLVLVLLQLLQLRVTRLYLLCQKQ